MKTNRWKIMPCPKDAGRHPYHDHRWIATEDAEVEFDCDGRDWALSSGSLICQMRDVDPKFARLIAAAPDLLEALQSLLDHEGEKAFNGIGMECDSEDLEHARHLALKAIAKATQ